MSRFTDCNRKLPAALIHLKLIDFWPATEADIPFGPPVSPRPGR